jgi:isopenicillin-N N-acyltransferase like protein
MPFPFVSIEGSPFERGRQFGQACGDQIRRYPDALRIVMGHEARLRDPDALTEPPDDAEFFRRARAFLPWIERFAPEQVVEMRGVADGAQAPFDLVLLCNVRSEVGLLGRGTEGCTAVALGRRATADGSILIGQNQDQHPAMRDLAVVLRVEPDEGPAMLIVTFGGLLGYGGINSAGIGYMMNALANSVWRMGLPHYPVKRALLQQQSLAGCLRVFDQAPVGSCANNLLVDRDGIADVELTPDGYDVLRPSQVGPDVLVHTNHFQSRRLYEDDQLLARLPDSACRCERMSERAVARVGDATVDDLKLWFADHDGRPVSICRHGDERKSAMSSIFSVIGEPDRGRLHVCCGNPCEGDWTEYRL